LEDAPYRHVAAALLRIPALLAQLLRLAASGATPSRRTSRFE
jgi:c-di-GMP-related signal transduction protein